MDFISNKILDHVSWLEHNNESKYELCTHLGSLIEYNILLVLGYLWNKNKYDLDDESIEIFYMYIKKPSIGTVISLCRNIDKIKDKNRTDLYNKFDSYTHARNIYFGHGFTYSDSIDDVYKQYKEMSDYISTSNIFNESDIDIIIVNKYENDYYEGISLLANGGWSKWLSAPCAYGEFEIKNAYVKIKNEYSPLMPFVKLVNKDVIYIYCNIEDRLSGLSNFNRLIEKGREKFQCNEFIRPTSEDNNKVKSYLNSTIINKFKNNYKKYLDHGIKKEVFGFLERKNSVCATVWGHGGVGKTATVQSLCDDLMSSSKLMFNYIVFVSAKDRAYDYITGKIHEVTDRIASYDETIAYINTIINPDEDLNDDSYLINYSGKILLIIDDFETFSSEDRVKFTQLIQKFDTKNHKVIFTTRLNIILGEEIQTNEFDEVKTVNFLKDYIKNNYIDVDHDYYNKQLTEVVRKKIFNVTGGRPLFILQFAMMWVQKGRISTSELVDIKSTPEATEFLYGRIYDYLSDESRMLFKLIYLLVDEKKLCNTIDKLQLAMNNQYTDSSINAAIKQLIDLKVIEIDDNIFTVYSNEILNKMMLLYNKLDSATKRKYTAIASRLSSDPNKDGFSSMLENAKKEWLVGDEKKIIENYIEMVDASSATYDNRFKALFDLVKFLYDKKLKKDMAVEILYNYKSLFGAEPDYVKLLAVSTWNNTNCKNGDNRNKAIRRLNEYLAQNDVDKLPENKKYKYFEILALYITYKLKSENKYYNEILCNSNGNDKDLILKSKKGEFKSILNKDSNKLINYLSREDNVNGELKQKSFEAFTQMIDICVIVNKHEMVDKILKEVKIAYSNHQYDALRTKYLKYDPIYKECVSQIKLNSTFSKTLSYINTIVVKNMITNEIIKMLSEKESVESKLEAIRLIKLYDSNSISVFDVLKSIDPNILHLLHEKQNISSDEYESIIIKS